MRIGVSVKMRKGGYDRFGDEKYNRIKAHGFDCVDFDMCSTEHELYLMSEQEFAAHLQKERELAQAAGIAIHQTHGPWRWPIRDFEAADVAERLEKMEKSIRATALLGSRYWVIHPLMPYGLDDIRSGHEAETLERNISFFTRLLQTAKAYGVTICIENTPFPDFSLATPLQVLRLVRELNDSHVKMCLDTGHVAVFAQLSPADELRQMADEIRVLHVHDNGGEHDEHLPPFEGIIDWQDFSAALQETCFDGVLSLEIVPKESLPTDEFERQSIRLAEIAKALLSQ